MYTHTFSKRANEQDRNERYASKVDGRDGENVCVSDASEIENAKARKA